MGQGSCQKYPIFFLLLEIILGAVLQRTHESAIFDLIVRLGSSSEERQRKEQRDEELKFLSDQSLLGFCRSCVGEAPADASAVLGWRHVVCRMLASAALACWLGWRADVALVGMRTA